MPVVRFLSLAVSLPAVEGTIETFADPNDAPMEWGRLAALRRIDRLRDRASRE